MAVTVSCLKSAARNVKARGGLVATEKTFFSRWSQRKLAAEPDQEPQLDTPEGLASEPLEEQPVANKSSVETESGLESNAVEQPHSAENEEPSVASLLVSGASQELKKAALRKLFLSGEFSEVCMLDDYNADFSNTATLTTEVAQTLRQWWKETDSPQDEGEEQIAVVEETVKENQIDIELADPDLASTTELADPINKKQPSEALPTSETKYTS
ncbi:DUF3306 domain-containing protein [Vibrio mimicus]|uniref:DUF3306 domain-containing protein n=1 Tax=Vibrio mimicus TaxID=674 RepID=UPI000E1B8654|nr:DUF3306 domain-containing protein [Vibrio mimicus]MBY7674805.1 DUF3306 domain-containing protein [Vibrio mimicus]MBY7726666.1 DUF3306 domain-containing protein [Vibrio mimicus]TXY30743.1 DUF3306 domain-containing protein [Vibrio mimicus]